MDLSHTLFLKVFVVATMTYFYSSIFTTGATHFAVAEGQPKRARSTASTMLLLFLINLAIALGTPMRLGSAIAATVLFAIGLLVFRSAVQATQRKQMRFGFSAYPPPSIVRSGAYRWVRHPFYVSYALFWAGLTAATLHWFSALSTIVVVSLWVKAALFEEGVILRSRHADEYRDYMRRVGRFFPRLNGSGSTPGQKSRWPLVLVGLIFAVNGVPLAVNGTSLMALGGSWYYTIAGTALVASGVLFALRRMAGFWLFAAVFAGTLGWAFWEVGMNYWKLMPRLAPVGVLAVLAMACLPRLSGEARFRKVAWSGVALLVAVLAVGFSGITRPHGVIEGPSSPAGATPVAAKTEASAWQYYGRSSRGTRYAPETQITKENVGTLEVAWTFRTGDIADKASEDQNTPIQIGDTVYVCTPHNKVFALDADTGKQRWTFDPKADSRAWNRCRGVGYYKSKVQGGGDDALAPSCRERIVLTTVDARLIQLDAKSGKPCGAFGQDGTVDLKQGMGEVKPPFYFQTSMPTVARGLIIVGGWVLDGISVGEPSGVVRAFSAENGELVWAWDLGNPQITKLPPAGQTYTRGTPNVWSTPAFDEELGLIYLPTGNSTPDFWGAHRSEASEKYSSSVVALDIETGRERWKFQTVHHDLWDYDVPSQPALYDVPDGRGGTVPALIQLTKRGQIFLLDRRDGKPIAEVQEKPAPGGPQEGDWVAKTQPYSVGMPAIGAESLTEADMWGATWFDQLSCRIAFKKLRYDGEFTPPTTKPTLIYPGYAGGMNWGSGAIDEQRGILIVNDMRFPFVVQLVPPGQYTPAQAAAHGLSIQPQLGTPWSISQKVFISPLNFPCQAPPWGTVTGIDLKSRSVIWQRPAGTIYDAPGNAKGNRVPLGMPTLGGPMTTASGLTFHSGTRDYFLRAYDTHSGQELWKGRLPVGSQGTPITYVSPKTNRQYVVVAAGGVRQSPDRADYVVAWRLKGS